MGPARVAAADQRSLSSPVSANEAQQRAEALLRRMTLEEKIKLLGGVDNMFTQPIPRLGIPALKMSDGPVGVRVWGPSNEYPAGIAMAASWDADLEHHVGIEMGKDARARGVNTILGPGMNIYRAPMAGRNFEYFGEDPYLASRMAVAVIEGIQSQGVMATAKHFAANNQEYNRHNVSSDMDERTLREIYLPAFEAAVREAHVGAIMDSYNLVNGVHSTQNAHLMRDILRHDWGFQGIIMSDWGATYDGVAAANAGLDLEMPDAKFMNAATIEPAIRDGRVSEATIDEKVRHILRTAISFGFFDRPQMDASESTFNEEGRQVARKAALGSMVLLKNDPPAGSSEKLLPLDKTKLRAMAVIGPEAYPAAPEGGGSAYTDPIVAGNFLQAMADDLQGTGLNVLYTSGTADPPAEERPGGGHLLKPVFNELANGAPEAESAVADEQTALQRAKEIASRADVVILCVGFSSATEREDHDRTFALPPGQDDLLQAVLAANPRTVVVLTAGGNVDMSAWIDKTPALLDAWYPGEEGGAALAEILFGEENPSGKLPVTFEKRWEDSAAYHSYYDGGTEHVRYSEGVFLGYRHFDQPGAPKPRFPFGYGLSYTSFGYSGLEIAPRDAKVRVSFTVTNTGKRAGAEVAEIYVGEEHPKVPRPLKELKGFAKLELKPGESRKAVILLDQGAFSYWDESKNNWTMDPGLYRIYVGSSSEEIRLSGEISR